MVVKSFLKGWEEHISNHRNFLISFAYRMTGSYSLAEDIVQDSFIECAGVDPATILNHKSWLTKVCSNKALDHLKKAHVKRESYPGVWLPDAIPENTSVWEVLVSNDEPEKYFLMKESLSTSFLLLVDKLSAEERVVYVLAEIFDYSFKEISAFLDKGEGACRKIAERARDSINKEKSTTMKNANARKMLLDFFEYAKAGDNDGLTRLLAKNSQFWGDGGGKAPVFSSTVMTGSDWISNIFIKLAQSPAYKKLKIEFADINSEPGVILLKVNDDGIEEVETYFSFEFEENKITKIFAQRNPEKFI